MVAKFQGKRTLIQQTNAKRCFDAEAFEQNRKWLRKQKHPCAICEKPWKRTFQIDHITPLALYRDFRAVCEIYHIGFIAHPDGLNNLQSICKPCHDLKSKIDFARIWQVKRALGINSTKKSTTG